MTHLRKIMLEELHRRHYSEINTRNYVRTIEARCPVPQVRAGLFGANLGM